MLAENFVLLDSLLFKLVTTPDKETALLAIPEICVDKIIALYHASLFAGHQGVVKMYLNMKDKFFVPGLMHYLRSFIKECHICQLARFDKLPMRQLQPWIYLNYRPLSSEGNAQITKVSQIYTVHHWQDNKLFWLLSLFIVQDQKK